MEWGALCLENRDHILPLLSGGKRELCLEREFYPAPASEKRIDDDSLLRVVHRASHLHDLTNIEVTVVRDHGWHRVEHCTANRVGEVGDAQPFVLDVSEDADHL